MPKNPPIVFEDTLAQLEQLVAKMERGEMSLQESLQAYELGTKLASTCHQALTDAERKVQALSCKNPIADE